MCTNVEWTVAGKSGRAESPATCSKGDVVPDEADAAGSSYHQPGKFSRVIHLASHWWWALIVGHDSFKL